MDDTTPPPPRPRQVRLSDVARVAKVSVATVSRALSHPEMLSPETRQLVESAILATGYRINIAARNLRQGRTGAVVALVPNMGNPFFANILAGMGEALNLGGYDLLVADTVAPGGRHRALRRFLDPSRADGIILLDGEVSAADLAAIPTAPPMVMACEWVPGLPVPRVVLDNEAGTEMAARHLVTLGHRRIGWIGGPVANVLHRARLQGVRRVLGDAGDAYAADFSLQSGASAAQRWLAQPADQRPTALIAFSDEAAAGFMGTVQRHGLRVPDDVSIIGFDGIDWVAHLPVPLTTIRQPKRELGWKAAAKLLEMIDGAGDQDDCILQPELILRRSTAKPGG